MKVFWEYPEIHVGGAWNIARKDKKPMSKQYMSSHSAVWSAVKGVRLAGNILSTEQGDMTEQEWSGKVSCEGLFSEYVDLR